MSATSLERWEMTEKKTKWKPIRLASSRHVAKNEMIQPVLYHLFEVLDLLLQKLSEQRSAQRHVAIIKTHTRRESFDVVVLCPRCYTQGIRRTRSVH